MFFVCLQTTSHVLGVADRQNDSVLLRRSGQLFHVGFSEIFVDKRKSGGLLRAATPFTVTRDFEKVIVAADDDDDDDNNSDDDDTVRTATKWQEFVSLGARAFTIVRRNAALFVTLFSLMLSAKLGSMTDLTYLERVLVSKDDDDDNDDDVTTVRWEKLIRQQQSSFASSLMQIVRNNISSSRSSSSSNSSGGKKRNSFSTTM